MKAYKQGLGPIELRKGDYIKFNNTVYMVISSSINNAVIKHNGRSFTIHKINEDRLEFVKRPGK